MLEIGKYKIVSAKTGMFRLDGGAMFGVVPKTLWAPREDVDDQNRILLATRTLIAVSDDRKRVILVDTGLGTKWPAKEAERFAITPDAGAIARSLAKNFDLSSDDVTDIVVTHLHFDHNGGLTEWVDEPGQETRLLFPRARHWIHRRHWEHAQKPSDKDKASFLSRDMDALRADGVLVFVDGDAPACAIEGVRFFVADGHTPAQLLPIFDGLDGGLMYVGDVIPTSSHLRVPWLMAYDVEPLRTIEEKKRIYADCVEAGLQLAFPHDHRMGGAKLDFASSRPIIAHELSM